MIDFSDLQAQIAADKAAFASADEGENVRGGLIDIAEDVSVALGDIENALNGGFLLEVDATLTQEGQGADAMVTGRIISDVSNRVSEVENSIGTKRDLVALEFGRFFGYGDLIVGEEMPAGETSNNGRYTASPIDISYCSTNGAFVLELESLEEQARVAFALTDENNIVLEKYVTSNVMTLQDGVYKGSVTVNNAAVKFLYFSVYKGSSELSITLYKTGEANQSHVRFVATNGDDKNDGKSSNSPMATINKAIESGGRTIRLSGGKYCQNILLDNVIDSLRIVASEKNRLPILYAPESLIAEEETAVSGYTKVYSCPCEKTFSNKVLWIYQDGVPDASTEISIEDRHPLQRGKAYRCDDTKITICESSALLDALEEIEHANAYKWYLDEDNHVLYFSRPQAVSSANPILYGDESFSLFYTNKTGQFRSIKMEMVGVGIKYQKVNLRDMTAPVFTDCFCGNVTGPAAFSYDGTSGAKFYRCEAFRVAYTERYGDGFNAHSGTTGDAFAKQSGCFLFDCWAHDCADDGYSDHERCETSIYGGLYENNGGAGVTPAQGSHCTCYNVFSRYNGEADFFYTGNPISGEGGVGGQIACYGCVSKGNGSGRGFRLNGSNVQGLFVNCVAINRATGFASDSTGDTHIGNLINCSTVNCTTQKAAIFTAVNGTPVV